VISAAYTAALPFALLRYSSLRRAELAAAETPDPNQPG
jgi:hypothetical protein